MNIIEISKKIEAGGKGRRSIWEEGVYIYQEFGRLYIKSKYDNGKEYDNDYSPFIADLYANDWEIYEEPKPILDAEEKAYLEAVLRPFKDRVVCIHKSSAGDYEYLRINIKSDVYTCVDTFTLPFFKANTMYKNMKILQEYTLKELGLFDRKIY